MAAEMVGSAVAQEVVSGASSYISGMLEERAAVSRAHILARLEMALSQLAFALERAGKLPITYVSLLRRMKILRRAYTQGTALLNKHKKMVEDVGRRRPGTTLHLHFVLEGIFRSAASLARLRKDEEECLSSSVVRRFEWYAACADKFLADVESGCPLLRGDQTFRYPLLRHLLEGKTLCYHKTTTTTVSGGSRRRQQVQQSLCIWPVRLEERGMEARLMYQYLDRERPERRFGLRMMLRLSEDTEVIGIAVKCLRSLTSQFKLATASDAVGELTMMHYLQDIAHSYGPPLDWTEEAYVRVTKTFRPDPVCCTDDTASSVVPPHGIPEPVIAVGFGCYVTAPECNNILELDGGGRNAATPLYMVAGLVPHDHHPRHRTRGGIVLSYGGKEQCLGSGGDSIQQAKHVLRLKPVVDCVVGQSEPADYVVTHCAPNGFARVKLRKASDEQVWTTGARTGHCAAKRKR